MALRSASEQAGEDARYRPSLGIYDRREQVHLEAKALPLPAMVDGVRPGADVAGCAAGGVLPVPRAGSHVPVRLGGPIARAWGCTRG